MGLDSWGEWLIPGLFVVWGAVLLLEFRSARSRIRSRERPIGDVGAPATTESEAPAAGRCIRGRPHCCHACRQRRPGGPAYRIPLPGPRNSPYSMPARFAGSSHLVFHLGVMWCSAPHRTVEPAVGRHPEVQT
jgi:hypothetical protein